MKRERVFTSVCPGVSQPSAIVVMRERAKEREREGEKGVSVCAGVSQLSGIMVHPCMQV